MSTWIEIDNQEDVEYAFNMKDGESIDVYIGSDDCGNNYVSIPLPFIRKVMEENKYYIEEIPG